MSARYAGTISREGQDFEIRLERELSHTVNAVWKAITDPAKLAIWFAKTEIEQVPGGAMHFRFADADQSVGDAVITQLEPDRLFEYNWEGDIARWELFPLGNEQCRLVMIYRLNKAKYVTMAATGWHIYMEQLEGVLNGRATPYPYKSDHELAVEKIYKNLWEAGGFAQEATGIQL